ncbi:unnamed protein product [Orchesella dallaii]|uniref:Uncharacterized protein n=1 Tax=Orchesella dallaii TaxID=48710 RepID=A0ABP1RI78_9HEXA
MFTSQSVQVLWMFFFVRYFTKSDAADRIKFDRNFTGITFNPHISHINDDSNAYSASDIEGMLKVISRRFSHVIVRPAIEAPSTDSSTIQTQSATYTPVIAAKLNRNSQIPQSNSFNFKLKLTIDLVDDATLPAVLTKVDHALHLAAEANSIHPGTVTTLLIDVDDIEKNKSQNMSIQVMSYIRNQNQTLNQDLQVGLWILMEDCGSSSTNIPEYTRLVLQHADLVIFNNLANARQVALGAHITSQSMIRQFSNCEKKLRKSFQYNLKIMWSTSSSSLESEGYSHSYFI